MPAACPCPGGVPGGAHVPVRCLVGAHVPVRWQWPLRAQGPVGHGPPQIILG